MIHIIVIVVNNWMKIGEHTGISSLTKKPVKLKNNLVADHLLFCNHSASYDDFSILTRENKKFLLEMKEGLLKRGINHFWIGTLHGHHCVYLKGPCCKICFRILFAFNRTFYYFGMRKCLSTTVRVTSTVQFTFFLIMRLNITIVTSCDCTSINLVPQLILTLLFHHLSLKMDWRNTSEKSLT